MSLTFTEFFTDPVNGNNAWGGSDSGTPSFTDSVGSWDGTSVYTTAASTAAVNVGQFANVGGNYVARVTAKTSSTITLSTTAKSGTSPGSGTATINVGGAFLGPNGATAFPFNFLTSAATNASGNVICLNMRNNASYVINTGITHTLNGPLVVQGFNTTVRDGGRATIDSGTNAIVPLTVSGSSIILRDLIILNAATTGSNVGFSSTNRTIMERVTVNGTRVAGVSIGGAGSTVIECEAYGCNTSNTANTGGFIINAACDLVRCTAHGNTGSNNNGFYVPTANGVTLKDCIAASNGLDGVRFNGGSGQLVVENLDSYSNGSAGLSVVSNSALVYVENSTFANNGTWGIITSGSTDYVRSVNNAFYSNSSGQFSGSVDDLGTVTCGSQPMASPSTGNFVANTSDVKNKGRGYYPLTGYGSSTTGYPDVGIQHQDAGGGGGVIHRVMPWLGGS